MSMGYLQIAVIRTDSDKWDWGIRRIASAVNCGPLIKCSYETAIPQYETAALAFEAANAEFNNLFKSSV